jgi:hypothetical protein
MDFLIIIIIILLNASNGVILSALDYVYRVKVSHELLVLHLVNLLLKLPL